MGVVYEAFDRHRNAVVALKTLLRSDAPAIFGFKREFRALTGINHRNLINLYELIDLDGEMLFTMELVRGTTLLAYVRGEDDITGSTTSHQAPRALAELETRTVDTVAQSPVSTSINGYLDEERLRDAFGQLCEGVVALHAAGRLHRDIKPSNVLVERDSGRVVLCDFGLAADVGNRDVYITSSDRLVGTIAYMSPEQAGGRPLTKASDWYSMGIVLYRALTGTVPFLGARDNMLRVKQMSEPASPRSLVPDLPGDLADLCEQLIKLEPSERPDGAEILRRLGRRASVPKMMVEAALSSGRPFVGRRAELFQLLSAFEDVRHGEAVSVFVRGRSGMGKTALVREFLDQVQRDFGALVFTGRCFQNELLRYKAFDNLIDDIAAYLSGSPRVEVDALLPPETTALARLFPVLKRIPAVAEPRRRTFGALDPSEQRRLAFRGLRELLANLADAGPLVLFIDDLQWGDVDSAALLVNTVLGPDAPGLLLVATYREEEAETSPLLVELERLRAVTRGAIVPRLIALGPLSERETDELAAQLLASTGDDVRASAITREARGHPLLVDELVRHHATRVAAGVDGDTGPPSLDQMLRSRFANLPETAREILAVIAVAARPTPIPVVEAAVGADSEIGPSLSLLEAQNLLRPHARDELVTYHDRVRESVIAELGSVAVRDYHRRLAEALQRTRRATPRVLVEEWLGAGDRERAALEALPAAAEAVDTLAFERAAELYSLALEFAADLDEERDLRVNRAKALENSGHCSTAADEYLRAADGAQAASNVELRQKAALAFLRSGHIDRGVEILADVLDVLGYRYKPPGRWTLPRLALARGRLRLRGLHSKRRDESQVTREDLARIDACWTASVGLGMADTIIGAEFQSRHLLAALRAGEPVRLARALALEIAFLSVTARGRRRAAKLLPRMQALAEELDDPYLRSVGGGCVALYRYQNGEFHGAVEVTEAYMKIMRTRCAGVSWELATGEMYRIWALYFLGEIRTMAEDVIALRASARDVGDLYAAGNLFTGVPAMGTLFADGDVEAVEQMVDRVMEPWSRARFHLQHYYAGLSRAHCAFFRGQHAEAHEQIEELWTRSSRAMLSRIDMIRFELHHLRAQSALARRDFGRADRAARQLEKHPAVSMRPVGTAMRGAIAAARGRDDEAVALLERAQAALADGGLRGFENAARHARGALIGGDEGEQLQAAARQWAIGQGIANPERTFGCLILSDR